MMAVSLYTVRIVLDTLGVIDYGLYNVVGGVVIMFSFLSGTMSSASQRFFSLELGRKNFVALRRVFSMTMIIYGILSLFILILAETVGLWFLNNKMVIPPNRLEAAHWVYQCSILTFMVSMFTIPYNAMIVARERMGIYAYVSILEAILKLFIVYALLLSSFDKLKLYAVLLLVVTAVITLIYRIYSLRNFKECRFSFYWNNALFKEITAYSGWNLFGSFAAILRTQGVNILLNLFFAATINAAWGIAAQVNSAITQFVSNFTKAVNPQITKYYASGEVDKMSKLVFQSSKFSYLLLLILSMPLLLETEFILSIWLTEVPPYVVVFTRLVIINALVESFSPSLITAALSTGRVRRYQLIIGSTVMLTLPISYLFLKLGHAPQVTFYVTILLSLVNLFARLKMLNVMINFPSVTFLYEVIGISAIVTACAYLVPCMIIMFDIDSGLLRTIITCGSGFLTALFFIYTVGLSKEERQFLNSVLLNKISLIKTK
ncbi:lipopolysaccharide biosynthesis protein [Sphingobacterium haloxyli]|nr:lipopolysaccharide biosynthesis protein [Sphingobacterium haloxyli]